MFAPDTPERAAEGYPMPGELTDVNAHEAHMLPEPGYSPDMVHGTGMAGETLPMPMSPPKAVKQAKSKKK